MPGEVTGEGRACVAATTVSRWCQGVSPVSKVFVRMGQSFRKGAHIIPSSGVRLSQAPFCAYAMVINESPSPEEISLNVLFLTLLK